VKNSSHRLPLLISVSAGEKDKAAMSHESFLLMANSQSDMDDWVKAIRRVIWAPFGGGKYQVDHKHSNQYKPH